MKSMTGFGAGRLPSSKSQIEVSIRSVNGRFLETRFHLPREFHPFESDLKKILGKYFQRGTIDIFVNRKLKAEGGPRKVVLNKELARQYAAAYNQVCKELKVKTPIHAETIMRMPEVLKIESENEISDSEKKAFLQAFDKACKACDQERRREGKSLHEDLEIHLAKLEENADEIQNVREEANQGLLQKFEQKMKARLQDVEIDSIRLSQEVIIHIDKTDINEELSRLREHFKNYRNLLGSSESQGKKLDFYTQELLREVNTIGSKSSLSKLTQIVVEAKTNIERLREQIQNVE